MQRVITIGDIYNVGELGDLGDALPPIQLFDAGTSVYVATQTDPLNVRDRAWGSVVDKLPKGTFVTTVAPTGDEGFIEVEYMVGSEWRNGFVYSGFLSDGNMAPPAPAPEQPAPAPLPDAPQPEPNAPEASSSHPILWILGAVAVGGAVYYIAKKRKKKAAA